MKKYLLIVLTLLAGLLCIQTARLRASKANGERLSQNQITLMSDMEHYRTKAGEEAASAQVLRLKVGEFERLRAADAAAIRSLGVKLKRVEATAKTATATVVELHARLWDTVILRNDPGGQVVADSMRVFRWRDPWVTVDGLVGRDSVTCRLASVDTLRQVIHRVPRRFLFIRWGTKAIRQEVVSSNPHTRIVFSEYVKFEK